MLEYAANLCETDTLTPADLPKSDFKHDHVKNGTRMTDPRCLLQNSGETGTCRAAGKSSGYTLGKNKYAAELGISLKNTFTASLTASTYSSLILHHDKVLYI